MKMKQTLLVLAAVAMLTVGCATAKKVSDALISAPGDTLASALQPFVTDATGTNLVPNPALVDKVNAVGAVTGPWGLLGSAIVGAGLAFGAAKLNAKRK